MSSVTSRGVPIQKPKFTYTSVTGLILNAGDTYQLDLPSNCYLIEAFIESSGNPNSGSGGNFICVGGGFQYCLNTSSAYESTYKGVYINCTAAGLVTVSSYRHCGLVIKGFRMWYIE